MLEKIVSRSNVSDSCNPVDCSPPGSSVRGIPQARIQEWIAISFSRGSSQPRDWTRVSHISGRFFTIWATYEDSNRFNLKKKSAIWYAENMNAIKWTSHSFENKNVKTYTVYTFYKSWWIIAMI